MWQVWRTIGQQVRTRLASMIVRVKSHRANEKLKRLLSDSLPLQWYWSFEDGNNFVEVPDERLPEVLEITGITRARPKGQLRKCWDW